MAITPLPKPIPSDLKQIESLIKERFIRIDGIDAEIEVKQTEKSGLRDEIGQLQDAGKKLLMITPRPKAAKQTVDPQTGAPIV